MANYQLLVHETFARQYAALKARDKRAANSLHSKLKVIGTNPRGGGAGTLSQIADPDLAGKLLKAWIGGNNGHRLVYLATECGTPGLILVCPILVSAGRKSSFDYDSIGIDDVAPIVEAIAASRWSEFQMLDDLDPSK